MARVVADGLSIAGYDTRIVQLDKHVGTEVFYDNSWHFIDADMLQNREMVLKWDGTIPSALEIHQNRQLAERFEPYAEVVEYQLKSEWSPPKTYAEHFSSMPYYYIKTADAGQEANYFYGWDYYRVIKTAGASVGPQ